MLVMLAISMLLSAGAFTVSLSMGDQRAYAGRTIGKGQQDRKGQRGSLDAPASSYQCQMLFPENSSSGTLTTFYWPAVTNRSNH